MTGEKLFLRYAFPCVETREEMGVISSEHRKELNKWIEDDAQPSRRRLKYCFPNAFRALRELAESCEREVWSVENVKDYWRNHHKRTVECGVNKTVIDELEHEGRIAVTALGKFLNVYKLLLEKKQLIYTHKRCVVETISSTLS